MRRNAWKAITKRPLQASIESIRNQFGTATRCLALDTERRCRNALTAPERSRQESEIFREHYVRFSKSLVDLIRVVFAQVHTIAARNRVPGGPIEWTRRQLNFMLEDKLRLSGKECRIKDWIVYACDGYYLTKWPALEAEQVIKEHVPVRFFRSGDRDSVRNSWLAPAWFRAQQYHPETAWNREAEERSQGILENQSYLLVGLIRRELDKLAQDEHFRRAVTPIDSGSLAETATMVEMREKPLKLPPAVAKNRLLEECYHEGVLTERQYEALNLNVCYQLTQSEIGRRMGISRQRVAALLSKGGTVMQQHLKNRNSRQKGGSKERE